MDYRNINNMEDLEIAHRTIRRKLRKKENEICNEIDNAGAFYSPTNIIGLGLRQILIPFNVSLIRNLRNIKQRLLG